MYTQHPVFNTPSNEEIKVWRYMDFTKFLNILERQSLFFTRSDRFEDKFEGSYTRYNVRMRPQVYNGQIPEEGLRQMSEASNRFRRFTFVNCWHMNEHESAAMWRLYSQSNEAVAIQSTFARLRDSFNMTNEDIYIGMVNYIDYEREWMPEGNLFYPFVHKRLSFEHEHEIRALYQYFPTSGDGLDLSQDLYDYGINIEIDINVVIERIYVSPLAPRWFFELVQAIVQRYGLNKEVIYSDINSNPVF
ncbi:MAG: hypothetical protein Q8936_14765 [Bacillota bacterium]|nr:hypothetical protein [Bacillota bacterium]